MIFDIQSFEGPIPLRFGMSPGEVRNLIGPPRFADSTAQGTLCHWYDLPPLDLTVEFGGRNQTTDYFSFGRQAKVQFCGIDLFGSRSAWHDLLKWSSDYHVCKGCLVFCDLGIALSGFHDHREDHRSVAVFLRDAWEELRPTFQPFELDPSEEAGNASWGG